MGQAKQDLVGLVRGHTGTALRQGDRSISYDELGVLVDLRAGELRRAGAAGQTVALERPKSVGFVVDYLAVLATGGTVVPIDPQTPAERRDTFRRLARPTFTIDGDGPPTGEPGDPAPEGAFVYFTSGSTGLPKPVLGSAAALAGFVRWFAPEFGIGPGDRFAFGSGISFEASLRDIFPPLTSGATLVVPEPGDLGAPESTVDWLARERITVVTAVPSVARTWLRDGRRTCEAVRAAFFIGEPAAVDVLTDWKTLFPNTAVRVNSYGSTEGGQATIFKRVDDTVLTAGQVPAGRPVPGTRYCFVDPEAPLTADVVREALAEPKPGGEIVIVSRACSHGYLGMAEENAKRFADLGEGVTAYRMGDLGRTDEHGELVVVGRADDEVKINGVRVHPAEVLRAIRAEPAIGDAFVAATREDTGARLTAYVVPANGHGVDVGALRRGLLDVLPLAMIPSRFVELPELPRARTGKVDREALTRLAAGDGSPFVPPSGARECRVAARFVELLGVERVSATDDLFALGGDSITAMRLAARVSQDFGVRLTTKAIFGASTVRGIAALLGDHTTVEDIPVLDRSSGTLPMSYAQRRLYFLQQLHPESPAYNVVEAVRVHGALDEAAARRALSTVVDRHEVLRTRCLDEGTLAIVGDARPTIGRAPIEIFPELAARPFDLHADLPVRVTIARSGADEWALLFVVHHIAADAWSCRLLLAEFFDAYSGTVAGRPAVQYADFAAWQRGLDTGDDLAYWRTRLAGAPPVLELPLDRPRPAVRSDAGAELSLDLGVDLRERLYAAARQAAVTPFALLLTAFGYVLHRHCATRDVVLGTPVSGRERVETEELIGCFVNTVVLRLDYTGDPSRRALVRRIWDRTLDDLDHQALPFEQLVAEMAADRDLAVGQLVQVLFNYYPATEVDSRVPDLTVEPLDVARTRAKFDLTGTVVDSTDGLRCTLTYATDLLGGDFARRFGEHFVAVLEALVDDLDAPAATLPPVPPSDPPAGPPPVTSHGTDVLRRFEAHASAYPENVAVRTPTEVIGYGDLNRRADNLAARLAGRRPRAVALVFERSVDYVVAMLAALKAGVPYVPLDPAMPDAHVEAVVAAAGADLVLTSACLDGPDGVPSPATPDSAMYVLFTSGSTGRPKGVVVEHRHFTAYLTSIVDRLGLPDGLDYALVSTLAADLGLTNVYGALATGGTLHVLPYEWATDPPRLAGYFRTHRIDVMKLVPSHLQAIAEAGVLADVVPRRSLVLAGEALPWHLVDAVRAVRPDVMIWNNYGPTETTVSVLAHRVPATPSGGTTVPLGRPLDHVSVSIVDDSLRPVPRGAAGELLIGGASVARGYLDIESDRFVEVDGVRAYRSGDRARFLPDGTVEFLGRLDRQVKIRGYRVEPGYVEAVLRGHPTVTDAAVTVRDDRLVAYVVGAVSEAVPGLLDFARAALPPYLVPSAVVALERLPLTPNGKLDWHALPEPDLAPAGPRVPPRDARDAHLAALWCEVLGLAGIGIDDDFFDAGGDSFSAMRLARRIGEGVRVVSIFQYPTVRRFADSLATARSDGYLQRLPGSSTAATVTATIVAVPFGGATAASYGDLARALPPEYPLYAVELPGHDAGTPDQPLEPFDVTATGCVEEILRTVDGPVVVYGHCVGAALAYEIAARLQVAGADLVGVVVGGAYPSPRLPGRLFDLWARVFPSDRWRADRLYRDMLRAQGGIADDLDPAEQAASLRALRHDARESEDLYSRRCHTASTRTVPALCVVGERDRITEFAEERHREWNLLCSETELAVIPDAGHYFLKHQAAALATTIVNWVGRSTTGLKSVDPPSTNLRGFALVTLGQLVSMVGSRAMAFALGIWVYLETGSVSQFSGILVAALLPGLLVLPFAGAAADRWNRRLLMVAGEVTNAAGTGICLLAYATGSLDLWHIYLAAGLGSVATSFQQPAYLAAVAQLVPKQYLARTNGVLQAVLAVSQAAGPLLGGVLIVGVGLAGVTIVDLSTVVVAVTTLALVRFPDLLFRRRDESIWSEIGGGARYIARRRSLVAMIVFFLAYNLLLGFALALLPPMVLTLGSTGTLSLATMVGALGGVAGGVVMAVWGGFARRATGMVGFVALTGAGMIVAGLAPSPALPVIGLAAMMASIALINGHWQTMIQVKVGMELQGRVLATNRMTANLTEPLGYVGAGWLADALFAPAFGPGRGMALLLVLLGGATLLLAVVGLRWRSLRYMEDALPDAVPGALVTWDRDALQREADRALAASDPLRPPPITVRSRRDVTGPH